MSSQKRIVWARNGRLTGPWSAPNAGPAAWTIPRVLRQLAAAPRLVTSRASPVARKHRTQLELRKSESELAATWRRMGQRQSRSSQAAPSAGPGRSRLGRRERRLTGSAVYGGGGASTGLTGG